MSKGNRSTAVMASRRPGHSFELYPTPPWATRAVIEQELLMRGWVSRQMTCWDPCCGRGHMVAPLRNYFDRVYATDICDHGFGDRRELDFSFALAEDAPWPVDWIFANPPFTMAEAFLGRALGIAKVGVALFVRLQWLEGGERYETVWSGDRRPHLICPFADRVPIIEDVWDPEASSATAYMWLIWAPQMTRPWWPVNHIKPGAQRRYSRLEDLELATPGEAARRRNAQKTCGSAQDAELSGEHAGSLAIGRAVGVVPAAMLARDPVIDPEHVDAERVVAGAGDLFGQAPEALAINGDAAELGRDRQRAQRLDGRRTVLEGGSGRGEEDQEGGDERAHDGHPSGAGR